MRQQFCEQDAAFLLSLKRAEPDWTLLGLTGVDQLPAVQWKLRNIAEMSVAKRDEAFAKLDRVVGQILGAQAF